MEKGKRPLDGIVVLDLTQALSGPIATCILADYGARVIKIEGTSGKEITRGVNSNPKLEADPVNGGDSFNAINRNKDGMCLNLRSDEGKEIMKKLLTKADILISNYRPGTTKKMGLDYDTVKEINPRLIACEIGAFREKGRENDAGFDVVVQAASGILACTGYPDQPPAKIGPSVTDITAGLCMVQGIMFALYNREKTGRGQAVEIRMQDAAMFLLAQYVTPLLGIPDFDVKRSGMCHFEATPSNGFKTKDGYLFIAPAGGALFVKFCEVIGRPELAEDPRFKESTPRMNNREELFKIIDEFFSQRTTAELFKMMQDAGLPASPIATPKEAFTTAYKNGEDIVATVHHRKHGDLQVIGTVVGLSETPGRVEKPAPRLGQDTIEVLKNMAGYTDEEIDEFEAKGVVRCFRE